MKHYYSIVITLICLGLFLFLAQSLWCVPNTFWNSLTGNLGCAVLIGGLISLLEHFFLRQENERRLAEMFNVSISIKESGLRNIMTNSQDYHYHDLIVRSHLFSAIMNDGRRWVGNHTDAIEKRFNINGSITEFFFVNPNSDFCKALERKTHLDNVEDQEKPEAKIVQTISLLKSTWHKSEKAGTLRIYYLKNYPTQTLFYTEDTVVATPYQTSSGRAIIPLYEYAYDSSKQSIASHLHDDLKRVRIESTCIYDSSK